MTVLCYVLFFVLLSAALLLAGALLALARVPTWRAPIRMETPGKVAERLHGKRSSGDSAA